MPQKQHVMHGRDHLPNGADPIPGLTIGGSGGGIQFDIDNVGGWLLIETNGVNPYGEGLTLNVQDGAMLSLYTHGGQILLTGGPIRLNGGAGRWTSSAGILLDAAGVIELRATGPGDNIVMTMASGKAFTVQNASGSKVMEVRNDGTVHIRTGASWVADL